MKSIDKPVFIVGSGRSGTTLLYNLLAMHPDLCWFSNLTAKFPRFAWFAVLHRTADLPLLSNYMKEQFWRPKRRSLRPSEGDSIYHAYCGLEDARRMTEADLTPETGRNLKRAVKGHLIFAGKRRFLSKQTTNNQHIRLINSLFPDAYYIHIIRDGRAVASSYYRTTWWSEVDVWWLGLKPKTWEAMGMEPIALCALQWQRNVEEILANKHLFAQRYIEVRYEDLVDKPLGTIMAVSDFCGFRAVPECWHRLPNKLNNMNYKWQVQLSSGQKRVLHRTIGAFLAQLGYTMRDSDPGGELAT